MPLSLGIDTGGTFTDAVLVDQDNGHVVTAAKALTTRHNLAIGIGGAIHEVLAATSSLSVPITPQDVTLVALSTTLATNALAEGHRGRVCLLLIGYDPELMEAFGFADALATDDVVYLRGGHDGLGNEVAPLDEEAARAAILARRSKVEAFAVSGYFGVRNPAHELRVRELVEGLTGLPVTCGHELTSRLDAVRRATTVALNAHLILPLRELITSVERTLAAVGIRAPLMVVKGDGSLVRAEWAVRRPIETVLSGPAASVVGGWHLAGRRDAWVVDVGGTTTDIAALREGRPYLNDEGASVAGWRTMIEAVDVHTTGLGGDSHVHLDTSGQVTVGPRRVIPLCLLADQHPHVVNQLRRFVEMAPDRRPEGAGEFLALGRSPEFAVTADDQELLQRLADGPQSLAVLVEEMSRGWLLNRRIKDLEAWGLVRRAGFTPTDALHVLGRFGRWNAEASRLGAELLGTPLELEATELCQRVVRAVARQICSELVSKIVEDNNGRPDWSKEAGGRALLGYALDDNNSSDLGCTLTLRRPLVAIGAPVAAYMPDVARLLHTELVIPPHAEVANAVGAVVGGVMQRRRVLISPLDDGRVRVHLPDGVSDFDDLETAVASAREIMTPLVEAAARSSGASQILVGMERKDQRGVTAHGQTVFLGSELMFTATGRPSPALRHEENQL